MKTINVRVVLSVQVLIAALFLAASPQLASGQIESIGGVKYAAPKGWNKTSKNGAVVFSDVNKTTNAFCVVTVTGSAKSAGAPQKDFANEWELRAMKPFAVKDAPKTEVRTDDGWTSVSGGAPVEIDGTKAILLLTVITGYGRTASVFTLLNDASYLQQLDAFMAGITMDKSADAPDVSVNESSKAMVSQPGTAGKFGHLIYKPMEGWKETRFTNAVSFTPNGISPEFNLEVRIMEAKPFNGAIQQAFAESWSDALHQLQSTAAEQPTLIAQKTSYQGWEYIRGEGLINNLAGDLYYLNLFVIKLNNRIERMFAVSQKIKERYGELRSLNQYFYSSAYDDLFYSVKFDDWTDRSPAATLAGGGIVGMYTGLKLGNGDLPSGGGLNGSWAVLFSNGQVYFTTKLPTIGFDGLNTQAEADLHVRNWGTYAVRNGTGALTMPYGPIPLSANSNGLILTTQNTPHQYIRVPSVDGAVFSGIYGFQDGDWGGKPTPSITFSPDGRFSDNGAMNILFHNSQERDALNPAALPGTGTYLVRNYSVIFTYSDGRRLPIAFSGLNYDRRNPSPATLTLSFNNDVLYKK